MQRLVIKLVNTFIFIGAVVCLIAFVLSVNLIIKQQNKEWDMGVDKKLLNNPVRTNPGIVAYVLFPIIVILGAIVLGFFYKW